MEPTGTASTSRFSPRISVRGVVAVAFLGLQAAGIVHARFVDTRYFCWAPHDVETRYAIEVSSGGRNWTGKEIWQHFRLKPAATNFHSPGNLMDVLRRTQHRDQRGEPMTIVLRYSVNGRPEAIWRWPEAP